MFQQKFKRICYGKQEYQKWCPNTEQIRCVGLLTFSPKGFSVKISASCWLSAGHTEKAVASFQAMVELNCRCPPTLEHSTPTSGQLAFLETFWDSGVPRYSFMIRFAAQDVLLSCKFVCKYWLSGAACKNSAFSSVDVPWEDCTRFLWDLFLQSTVGAAFTGESPLDVPSSKSKKVCYWPILSGTIHQLQYIQL